MAGLSGCGLFKPDPDAVAAEEMKQLLLLEPFAEATIAVEENLIRVETPTNAEAGLFLKPSAKAKEPIIVRYTYMDAEPLNLRLLTNGEYDYRSASAESYFVLGEGFASEALFYGAAQTTIRIEIEDVARCDEKTVACLDNGKVAFTPPFEGIEDALFLTPYQGATFEAKKRQRNVRVTPTGAEGEYGVFLTIPEPRESRMLLEFTLDDSDAELVTVRSGSGEGTVYDTASRGWVVVSEQSDALLYSSAPAGFAISDISLKVCENDDWRCKTHDDLKALLPSRNELTEFEYAVRLLTWATEHSDYAISSTIDQSLDPGSLRSWQIFFKYYAPNLAGGYCGDTAVFFSRLLRDSGFESFSWNFGMLKDDLTHVTTVLMLDGKYYMLDPTFGGYFTLPDSEMPIEVFDLVEGKPFGFRNVMSPNRDFIAAADDGDRIDRLVELGVVYDCEPTGAKGRIVCKRKSFGLDEYLRVSYTILEQNQLGNSHDVIIELMRQGLIGVGNMRDTDAMKDFARGLVERGVPIVDVEGNLSPRRLLP